MGEALCVCVARRLTGTAPASSTCSLDTLQRACRLLVFLGYYAAYVAYLILAAQQHDALPAFSNVMLVFVIPLTLATLIAVLVRKRG